MPLAAQVARGNTHCSVGIGDAKVKDSLIYIQYNLLAYHELSLLDTHLLADILRNSVLVYHVVHGVGCDEALGHIPNTLVVASLTP